MSRGPTVISKRHQAMCEICGVSFETNSNKARYCDDLECKRKGRALQAAVVRRQRSKRVA